MLHLLRQVWRSAERVSYLMGHLEVHVGWQAIRENLWECRSAWLVSRTNPSEDSLYGTFARRGESVGLEGLE